MMKTLLILAVSLLVVACSSDERDSAVVRYNSFSRSDAAVRDETIGTEIARDLNKPMNRARNVENTVMDQKAKLDEALEDL
jgi:hypothetical protein